MQAPTSPPPSSLPIPLRLINFVGRGLQKIGVSPSIAGDSLCQAACKLAPVGDFGLPDLEEPLRVLGDSLDQDAGLTSSARFAIHAYLKEVLHKRRWLADQMRQRPELALRDIAKPIFVVGMPRTGTTLLHNLLSQAPGSRGLRTWEIMASTKQMQRGALPKKPDWLTRGLVYWINQTTPGLKQVHPLGAEKLEECTMLTMNSLVSLGFQLVGPLKRYADWCLGDGAKLLPDAYRLHRFQLHLLSQGDQFDHWVLKAPTHLAALQELMTVYPTAQVVLTERDPATAVASTCSLFQVVRRMFCKSVDRRALGREAEELLGRAIERSVAAREQFGDRIFTVRYADLVARPLETVRELYDRMGRSHTAAMDDGIRTWLQANPQHKHGVHRYDESEFGLDPQAWRRRFGDAYDALFTAPATTVS